MYKRKDFAAFREILDEMTDFCFRSKEEVISRKTSKDFKENQEQVNDDKNQLKVLQILILMIFNRKEKI